MLILLKNTKGLEDHRVQQRHCRQEKQAIIQQGLEPTSQIEVQIRTGEDNMPKDMSEDKGCQTLVSYGRPLGVFDGKQ